MMQMSCVITDYIKEQESQLEIELSTYSTAFSSILIVRCAYYLGNMYGIVSNQFDILINQLDPKLTKKTHQFSQGRLFHVASLCL